MSKLKWLNYDLFVFLFQITFRCTYISTSCNSDVIFELMNSLFYHTIHCHECMDVVTVLIWTCTYDIIGPMDDVSSLGPIDGTVLMLQAHHRSTWI